VSTRDAVAGETPACSATSASLGRNFVSVPDTPASLPAIFGARPIGPRANSPSGALLVSDAHQRDVSGALRSCDSLLNIPVIPTALSRASANLRPTCDVVAKARVHQAGALVKVSGPPMAAWAAQNYLMKLSWDITTGRGRTWVRDVNAGRGGSGAEQPGWIGCGPVCGSWLNACCHMAESAPRTRTGEGEARGDSGLTGAVGGRDSGRAAERRQSRPAAAAGR